MAFIKSFAGALGGSFANQWLDYLVPPSSMRDHTLVARAIQKNTDPNRTSNTKGNENIISDGSKILVPEGTCLITVENGGITGVIAEPGGYTYTAQNVPEAKSTFAGDGFFASTFGQSWQQFKFGGQPGNQQFAFYINLKDIAGLRYGTQNVIRYKDANYNNLMLSVTSNGTYTIKVIDPILLFKNLIPVDIVSGQGREQFDLGDNDGGVEESLFGAFIGSLAEALSAYTKGGKSIDDIQAGTTEFAQEINKVVNEKYKWGEKYGLEIVSVQPMGLDWDEKSADMVQQFNTTMFSGMAQAQTMGMIGQEMAKDGGQVGAAYSQATIARGFEAAGNNPNGGTNAMFGMGMAMGQMGGAGLTTPVGGGAATPAQPAVPQQPTTPAAPTQPNPTPAPAPENPVPENPTPETTGQ